MAIADIRAVNVPTQFIEGANGIRYGYRRFGKADGVPLILMQHFRGNMDFWDTALLDALSAHREVIPFNNRGVSSTSGTTPQTVAQMARDAIAFIDALKLEKVDVLGFSLGGFVAQDVALLRPNLVRQVVLAGTGPQGGPEMHGWVKDIADAAREPDIGGKELLFIMFKETSTSQAKGPEYLGRFMERQIDRDPMSTLETRDAQYDAVVDWGVPDHGKLQRLTAIHQPTFVASGDGDRMLPPRLSYIMAGLIPNAKLKIYPDAAHGFLWQHNQEFASDVNEFLG